MTHTIIDPDGDPAPAEGSVPAGWREPEQLLLPFAESPPARKLKTKKEYAVKHAEKEGSLVRINVWMSDEERGWLDDMAEQSRLSRAGLILKLVHLQKAQAPFLSFEQWRALIALDSDVRLMTVELSVLLRRLAEVPPSEIAGFREKTAKSLADAEQVLAMLGKALLEPYAKFRSEAVFRFTNGRRKTLEDYMLKSGEVRDVAQG